MNCTAFSVMLVSGLALACLAHVRATPADVAEAMRAQVTICSYQTDFVRLPDPTDCRQYYQCNSGWAYLMRCPSDKWFNSRWQLCTDPDEVDTSECTVPGAPAGTTEPGDDENEPEIDEESP